MTPPQGFNGGLARQPFRFRTTILVVLALCVGTRLSAQTILDATWIGGIGSTNIATNWLGVSAVPTNGNLGINYNWIIDGNTTSPSVVTLNAAASIQNLTISAGDSLNIANAQSVTMFVTGGAGTLTNNGTLSVSASTSLTNLVLSGGPFTFSGSGTVTLGNSANNRLYGSGTNPSLTNAAGHTIQGSGELGLNLLAITNQGAIVANQATALSIDPNATGFINTGTLRATGGATLVLENGTFTNTGGTLQADDGSHVNLSAATVVGGTLTSTNTGHFHALSTSTLSGVTLTSGSTIELDNAHRLNLSGTIQNSGTIKLLASTSLTDLVMSTGGATLSGGGVILLSNSANNRIYAGTAGDTLINENNTITGAGQIGVNLLQLDNRGTISASHSGATLEIDPGSAVTNTGTMQAINGGILRLEGGTFINTGGIIHAATGSHVHLTAAAIAGGTLSTAGTGVIRTVGGGSSLGGVLTITPGSQVVINNATNLTLLSTGTFTNNGSIALNASTSLTDLRISGGDVTLSGSGTVTLSNSVNNRIYGSVGTERLVNAAGHAITGSGQIGVNLMALTNDGTIVANQTAALSIDPNGSGVTNSGVLRAESGATLVLENGVFSNTTTGTIRAQGTGSKVDFSGATISGGQLISDVGASLRNVSTSTYSSVTLAAGSALNVLNATTATFVGTFTNQANLAMGATTSLTDMLVSGGDLSLEGGGTISLSNSVNNRIYGAVSTNRLINVNNTIQGSGQIGVNLMGLVNQSTITANQTAALTIDPSAAGVTNTGLLRAELGATLELQAGAFNNAGGTIEAFGAGSKVNFDNAAVTSGLLKSSGGGTLRNIAGSSFTNITLDAGATLQILNATSATFHGTLTNGGTVQLLASTSLTDFLVGAGGLTLFGGVIELSNSANNRIYSGSGATLLNETATIRGVGQVGVNLMAVDNRATIDANVSGGILTLDPNGGGLTNTGLLTSSNGGILRLASGTFANAGGTISAGTSSRIDLENALVQGGLLGGSVIRNVAASTLGGLSIAGLTAVEVPNATTLTLQGSIHNAGAVKMQASTSLTDLIIAPGGVTLSGGGTIELSNSANNRIYAAAGTTVLNNVDNTIRGSGQLGVNLLTLTNTGTIEANQPTPLTVNLASPLTNQGTLRATSGGHLVFVDALTNAGPVFVNAGSTFTAQSTFTQTGGFIALNGGTFSAASATLNQSTGLFGAGTVSGAVTSNATIAPGANGNGPGIGQITFNHALTLQPTSLLHFELGGPLFFDKIQAPTATLGGALTVSFTNGFETSVLGEHTFTVLSTTNASGLGGIFPGLPNGSRLPTFDGFGTFKITYDATSVMLSDFVPVPEPSTYLLIGVGAVMVCLVSRRRAASRRGES